MSDAYIGGVKCTPSRTHSYTHITCTHKRCDSTSFCISEVSLDLEKSQSVRPLTGRLCYDMVKQTTKTCTNMCVVCVLVGGRRPSAVNDNFVIEMCSANDNIGSVS